MSRQLDAFYKVGVEFADYYNYGVSKWSPNADINATYTYLPGCTVQLGANVASYPSDVGLDPDDLTLDQLTARALCGCFTSNHVTNHRQCGFELSAFHFQWRWFRREI